MSPNKFLRLKRITLIAAIVLFTTTCCTTETNNPVAVKSDKNLDNLIVANSNNNHNLNNNQNVGNRTSSTETPPSIMSRIANWFFPFGGNNDLQTEQTAVGLPQIQYGPPPNLNNFGYHHEQQQNEDCNPCNEVPWIPINNQPPLKTVVEFIPPHHQPQFHPPPPPPLSHHFDQIHAAAGDLTTNNGVVNPPAENTYAATVGNVGGANKNNVDQNEIIHGKPIPLNIPPTNTGYQGSLYDVTLQNNLIQPSSVQEVPIHPANNFLPPKDNFIKPGQDVVTLSQQNYGQPPIITSNNFKQPNIYNVSPPKINFPPTGKQLFRPPKNVHSFSKHPTSFLPSKTIYGTPTINNGPLKLSHSNYPPKLNSIHTTSHLKPSLHSFHHNLHSHKINSHSHKNHGNIHVSHSYKNTHSPGPIISSSNNNYRQPTSLKQFSASQIVKDSYGLIPQKSVSSNSGNNLYAPHFITGYLKPPATKLSKIPNIPPNFSHTHHHIQGLKLPPTKSIFNMSHFGSMESNFRFPPVPLKNKPISLPSYQGVLSPPLENPAISINIPPAPVNQYFIDTQYKPPVVPVPTKITPTKLVTPTSDEYLPPPHQLPLMPTNQEEIQETALVQIPLIDSNIGGFLQPPLAPIPFPELNPGPLPPIHQAQPFYFDQTFPLDINVDPAPHIQTIEIHDDGNGNLQYLPNPPPSLPTLKEVQAMTQQSNNQIIKGTSHNINFNNQQPGQIILQSNHLNYHDNGISESQQNKFHNGFFLHQGLPSPTTQYNFNNDALTTEVKVVQSIPIAEFTSSIEYPASIAQSPIVDIVTGKDVNSKSNLKKEEHQQNSNIDVAPTASDNEESLLTKHPIVVTQGDEDPNEPYPAASSHNDTIESENNEQHSSSIVNENFSENRLKETRNTRGDAQPDEQYSNHNYNTFSTEDFENIKNAIKIESEFESESSEKAAKEFNFDAQLNANNQTQFTPPTLDYSIWAPSPGPIATSILPPSPTAGGIWITPIPTKTLPAEAPEGMKPPPMLIESQTQKTKQIQIIIPYKSNSKPTPFQQPGSANFHTNANWIQEQKKYLNEQMNIHDILDRDVLMKPPAQDSISTWFTSSHVPVVEHPTYVAESTGVDDSVAVPFDILHLQQNIDQWTAQEFASGQIQHNTNTVHETANVNNNMTAQFLASKKIPDEYLTTTPLTNEQNLVESVTINEKPRYNKFHPSKSYYDYEGASSNRHSVHTKLHNVTVIGDLNNVLFESNLIIPDTTTSEPTTEQYEESTTEDGTTLETSQTETTWETTTGAQPYYDDDNDFESKKIRQSSSPSSTSSTTPAWEKVQVSISPLTQEKVYVVTPQPWNPNEPTPASAWEPTPKYSVNEVYHLNNDDSNYNFSSTDNLFGHSGRFDDNVDDNFHSDENSKNIKIIYSEWPQSINNLAETTTLSTSSNSNNGGASSTTSNNKKIRKNFKSETTSIYKALWGLMDLTPYTPPPEGSVETHAGHSKVVTTVVTQASIAQTKSSERKHRESEELTSTTKSLFSLF